MELIQRNAAILRQLHEAMHEASARRSEGAEAIQRWRTAAAEFHRRYDELAFPGGLQKGLKLIEAGDLLAIETAIIYLEQRPFFYGAQYNRIAMTNRLKKISLPSHLQKRFQTTLDKLRDWREARRASVKRVIRPLCVVMPQQPPADAPALLYQVGQPVRVILNDRNRTPHEGIVANVIWHFKEQKWTYFLSENGQPVKKRYFEDDLEPRS